MKRMILWALTGVLCAMLGVTASAAGPAKLFPSSPSASGHPLLQEIEWRSSAIGETFHRWDDCDGCVHLYQIFLFRSTRSGAYYYTTVDLGPV